MKKDAKELLYYNVLPDIGLGELHFGMTKDEIFEKYNIEEYIASGECKFKINTKVEGGGAELFLFNESIHLYFTREKDFILVSIFLENKFKGKYLDKITIGTPFIELYVLKEEELTYDDEMYFPEGSYDFYMGVDMEKYEEQFEYISEYDIYSAMAHYKKTNEVKIILRNIEIDYIFFRKDYCPVQASQSVTPSKND